MKTNGILKQYQPLIALFQKFLDGFIPIATLYALAKINHITVNYYHVLLFGFIFTSVYGIFGSLDLYRSWRGAPLFTEAKRIVFAWLSTLAVLLILFAIIKKPKIIFSHNILWQWSLITPSLLISLRIFTRIFLRYVRSHKKNIRYVVIAGAGALGKQVLERMQNSPGFGFKVLGFFDDKLAEGTKEIEGIPVLGTIKDLPNYVSKTNIDMVYITLPFRAEEKMKKLVRQLSSLKASVFVVPDIFIFHLLQTRLVDFDGIPVFSVYGNHFNGIEVLLKRVIDILFGTMILGLIAIPMLVISILIKCTSKGPIIFKQRRYGLNNEEIMVYKFRSMTVCEDDAKEIKQAQKGDMRITKLGAFLRKTSLDELPQFINVLQGKMSIVGPRPHAIAHNEFYEKIIQDYTLRSKVKPGITGWAQVNGWRGETDKLYKMEKRIEYDLEYIRNWSLWLDIKIIFYTVFKGFVDKNAY